MSRSYHLISIIICLVTSESVAFTSPIQTSQKINLPKNQKMDPFVTIPKTTCSALPIPQEVVTSFLPSSLGFIKSEFGVSYGYGFATALTGLSILRQFPGANSILPMHAAALIFYGFRLNAFLLIRTFLSSRIRATIKKIEDRANDRGGRLSRTPFLLSCGLLYYGLAAPLFLTSKLSNGILTGSSWLLPVLKALVGLEWFGFAIAALGDLTKTYVKQTKKDEYTLVTSGIFSILRHPNYTGEMIGWTANALCGLVTAGVLLQKSAMGLPALLRNVSALSVGWLGIVFVLLQATTGLESRQKEQYGDKQAYNDWISSTWGGFTLAKKEEGTNGEAQLELNEKQIEESGSGI